MDLLDDVKSFFGFGDKPADAPITVPIPDDSKTADDPAVQKAQAAWSAAVAKVEALKDREQSERQLAEGKQSEDWMKQVGAAKAEYDKLAAQFESAKTKAQGGTMYDDEKAALGGKRDAAWRKYKAIENLHSFAAANPVSKYMNPAFTAEQKAAEKAELDARLALDGAKKTAQAKAASR